MAEGKPWRWEHPPDPPALLDRVVARLRSGNKGFAAARAMLDEAFASNPEGCRRLALILVELLVADAARLAAPAAAEPVGGEAAAAAVPASAASATALHENDARRHNVLCALILDCALERAERAGELACAHDRAELERDALRLGEEMPMIMRKACALCAIRLDEPPARQRALDAANALLEQRGGALREAALILAAARAGEVELGARAGALVRALAEQAAWPAASAFARASPALQRELVECCVRGGEHKRALALVRLFGLGPPSEYEHIYVHLELGRIMWLVRSGYVDLVHGALREAADAILALGGDGAPNASRAPRAPADPCLLYTSPSPRD